jgi:DNA primase
VAFRIPESVIAEVRERTDIVQVIGQYVSLKRSGANFVGLCPFHEEKTPSFVVSPQRHTYYCFGCHEKGDAIEFIRKIEGKGFIDAVEELASRAGITLPRVALSDQQANQIQRRKDKRTQALKLNDKVTRFFEKALAAPIGQRARAYLRSRGVDEQTARAFRLGYAPPGWQTLTTYLAKKEVPASLAVSLGLIKMSKRASVPSADMEKRARSDRLSPEVYHDFFRDRLMFPVCGPSGEVVGFSGRLLDPEAKQRKYVNSPESFLFHKAESLFGIDNARKAMRQKKRAILVEGNLDVIMAHQSGLAETVAPLGTALTDSQAHVLRRFAPQVVLMFDGDEAGGRAARKAALLLLQADQPGHVVELPFGEDPDSLIKHQGADALLKRVEAAKPLADYLIARAAREAGAEIPQRVRALEGLAVVLRSISNPVTRALYVEQAAEVLGIEREMVVETMRRASTKQLRFGSAGAQSTRRDAPSGNAPSGNAPSGNVSALSARDRATRKTRPDVSQAADHHAISLLALLVAHPHLAPVAAEQDAVSYIMNENLRSTLNKALDMQAQSGRVEVTDLLDGLDEETADDVAEAVLSEEFDGQIDGHRALKEILTALQLAQINQELERLAAQLRVARRGDDEERIRELALKRHELSAKRNDIIGERV